MLGFTLLPAKMVASRIQQVQPPLDVGDPYSIRICSICRTYGTVYNAEGKLVALHSQADSHPHLSDLLGRAMFESILDQRLEEHRMDASIFVRSCKVGLYLETVAISLFFQFNIIPAKFHLLPERDFGDGPLLKDVIQDSI